jgi:formamidopyrimidine-DNA glycosylase
MPELPEVETVRLGLIRLLPGHTIKTITHDWPKSFPNAPGDVKKFALGAKIIDVRRRAKVLIIDLDTDYSFVIHLKMTGQIVYHQLKTRNSKLEPEHFGAGHPNDSLIGELPDRSTRVVLELDGATLFFNDQRKFGWVRLMPTVEVPEMPFFQKVGPEPLDSDFTYQLFRERLMRRKNGIIKAVLLDQTVIAGVGNIYADEALFPAKIHPSTRVIDIPEKNLKLLYTELLAVLRLSIEKGGSSDRNYVNAEGKKGSYISFAKVFRKEGTPCQVCGTEIQKMRVAGRGTHICPKCQKLS